MANPKNDSRTDARTGAPKSGPSYFSRPIRRIAFSLVWLAATFVIGVAGYMRVSHYSFLDALYMTAITVSSSGFGHLKSELSPADKVFSIFITIVSVTIFIYAVSTLTAFIVEGEIRNLFKRIRVNNKIEHLQNHIIVCGLGRNGREAALELIRQRQPFVLVEISPDSVAAFEAETGIGVLFVIGDATHEDTLARANIKAAKGLVTTLPSDAENVYITLTARELKPDIHIVARASSESAVPKLRRAGASQIVNPYFMGGRRMANLLTRPSLIEFIELISGEDPTHLSLDVVEAKKHPGIVGKTLAQLQWRSLIGVNVLGSKRGTGNISLNPDIHIAIHHDDRLFIMGSAEQLASLQRALR